LLALVQNPLPARSAYLSAWLGGLVFWVSSLVWMMELHPAAWLAWVSLAAYQSLYWVLFLWFARVQVLRFRIPLMAAAPLAWVACEYVQSFALSGFPWYYLAHSQYRVLPVIQICDIFGTWGTSALLVLVNVWVLFLVREGRGCARGEAFAPRRMLVQTFPVALCVFAVLGYGGYRLATARFEPGPRVLLLQSNMPQAMKMSQDHDMIVRSFANLIRSAFAGEAKQGVDLVVWPETSYPPGWVSIDASAGIEALERSAKQLQGSSNLLGWFNRRNEATSELNGWSRELGCPMLVGVPYYELGAQGGFKSNGALWIDGRTEPPPTYRKMHLVPFGEYIPFVDVMPWIKRLAPYDDDRMPKLRAGKEPVWFDSGEMRYATPICFEDTLPQLVRRFFSEAPAGHQPDALVNISNDGWFNGTAEHEMHLASGVFRAVENRVPLIRVANMGYTTVVDGNGGVVRELPKKTEGTLTAQVPLDPRRSFYSFAGDWLGQLCLVICLCATAWAAMPWRA
jgi:apolipoprotein N-acyltransferase